VKRLARRLGLALAVAVVAIQLVPVDRSNPPERGAPDAPEDVLATLRRACYDCHSNETVWPWYSRVAPVSWLVAHDVEEGRKHLDFSRWETLPAPRRAHKLEEIEEVLREGEMPLGKYKLLHPEARLRAEDVRRIVDWTVRARPEGTGRTPPHD
jgi:hypothetical protein